VARVFDELPNEVRQSFQSVRELILAAAREEGAVKLDECLKWGQPSYLVEGGSAVRLGWHKDLPEQFSLLFHCRSRLVDTFREIYPDVFCFEGNRAITFKLSDTLPKAEIKHCIAMAFSYHRRKNLPLLGA